MTNLGKILRKSYEVSKIGPQNNKYLYVTLLMHTTNIHSMHPQALIKYYRIYFNQLYI